MIVLVGVLLSRVPRGVKLLDDYGKKPEYPVACCGDE
jgi:hypothetical protein